MGSASTFSSQIDIRALRDLLENDICSRLSGVSINGHREKRLGNTTNLSFSGVDGDILMKRMPDVAVSSSSACTSALLQPSYVLGAMGCSEDRARSSVRFSLGRFNTVEEITTASARVVEPVQAIRAEQQSL